jgi:hypothetical protein
MSREYFTYRFCDWPLALSRILLPLNPMKTFKYLFAIAASGHEYFPLLLFGGQTRRSRGSFLKDNQNYLLFTEIMEIMILGNM